jgi:hypothetical protein
LSISASKQPCDAFLYRRDLLFDLTDWQSEVESRLHLEIGGQLVPVHQKIFELLPVA